MAKGTSTTGYIGAWVVWVVSMLAFYVAYRHADATPAFWLNDPNLTGIAAIGQLSMLLMFVTWLGALVRLRKLRRWGWFAGLLAAQLLGAGILGIVMYAGVGPDDSRSVGRREVS